MRAVRFEKKNKIRLVEFPDPEPPPGWARIRVQAAAICATDFELLHGTHAAEFPLTPGHEWSGTVDRVGSTADESWIGERVVGDNEITCLRCRYCRSGEWRSCAKYRQIGFGAPGAYADYLLLPVHNLHRLPSTVSFEQGALLEPMGVALAVAKMSGARVGSTVIILGVGPIGLGCLAALKASGATRIICLDKKMKRLELAQSWGASVETVTASNLKETAANLHPHGTDIVVEAGGSTELLKLGMSLVRFGGTLVLAGYCGGHEMTFAPDIIQGRNVRVLGAGNNPGFLETAVLAAEDGLLRTEAFITHRFPLEEYERALAEQTVGAEDYIKGIFTF